MNSRVSWSVDGIDPSVRERAEAAARRAGLSLNDWLSSTVGDPAPPNLHNPPEQRSSYVSRDVADIHQRLDSITRQIEQISQPARRGEREQGVARQLHDAISRLDARLAQISKPQPPKQDRQRDRDAVERAAAQVYRQSPPLSPASFDSAIAEITARQNELDVPVSRPRPLPAGSSPPAAPQVSQGPDFSSLERHLLKITSQIEALQRPSGVEDSIAAFRSELAEIRHAILEAVPRRAIESIESEIRQLSRRIDDNRQSTADNQALAGIERALAEIRDVVRSLTPAEQLAGYDEAIRNLTAKLDMILRANDDPSTVQKLESAITALRAIVSNVASNDALERLSEDLRLLSSKVDQLARSGDNSDSFAMLERRVAALTSALETREQPQANDRTEQLEGALRALSERIDHLQVGNDNASAFAHLEQRVSYLLERLEASGDHRSDNLTRVEGALQDILGHLERQHAAFIKLSDNTRSAPEAQESDFIDTVRRELSDIRFSQNETNRHTQDSLEAVHSTLGHVVDRLTMIEGDLRAARADTPQSAIAPPPAPVPEEPQATPQPSPELPDPAAAQGAFLAAPRDFHAPAPESPPAAPPSPPAISEILAPHAAPRITITPDLPPDHPLEPGTRPGARTASPSERIAASESAISELPAAPRPPVSSSSFIAAARRAAQAAAAAQAVPEKGRAAKSGKAATKEPSSLTSKIRSVLVAASVVVIVLGTFKMAMSLLDGTAMPSLGISGPSKAPVHHPAAASGVKPTAPDPITPSMTSPTPIGRQSFNAQPSGAAQATASAATAQSPAMSPVTASDITGSIPAAPAATSGSQPALIAIPSTETLPDAIGGSMLRTAALKGDPTAAYEIAVRYAKGRGVTQNLQEAAKWYERAARGGIVPAIFRLGTFYEKGLGVKKDLNVAQRYYLEAAKRGNAKAMHNLAVLYAEGGQNGPDYKTAAQWFRKAAEHGVSDSQFNLGILYARGIGVEQNLAESYKWFSLAAAHGDVESGHKRDEVAKRLDAQSLAAAKLAVKAFTAEPQPDDAINVPTPPGGWDAAPAAAAKPAKRTASIKRAAR
jgi:localization factor PodJL